MECVSTSLALQSSRLFATRKPRALDCQQRNFPRQMQRTTCQPRPTRLCTAVRVSTAGDTLGASVRTKEIFLGQLTATASSRLMCFSCRRHPVQIQIQQSEASCVKYTTE